MKIEYFHASKHGNGAKVAEEFKRQMAAKGVTVNIHHVRDVKSKELPPADLYLFSSPGRFGKPIGDMRVIPIMNEMMQKKGLVKVAEGKIFVTGLKGPLEENWQREVEAFASQIPILP